VRIIEGGAYEIDSNSKLVAGVATMKHQIEQMSVKSVTPPPCSICGGLVHLAINCDVGNKVDYEQINAINQGNFRLNNNPYSNTYNPDWRNHPNFSWRQNDQSSQGNQNNQENQNFN
jgi:hypothetical protein